MVTLRKSFLILLFFTIPLHLLSPMAWAMECAPEAFTQPPVRALVKKPHLILFSAPSGGGKTTLATLLVNGNKNLTVSISSTTRAPRGQEKDGVDYYFLDPKAFEARIAAGDFAEHALVHGNYYGTQIAPIRAAFAAGKSVLALVDINGAEALKKVFPSEVFSIFINPPDMKTLEERLRGRGTDTPEAIAKRLQNAKQEMAQAKNFDRVVVNDDLQRAYGELEAIIQHYNLVP